MGVQLGMALPLPDWLDQVPNVDFTKEKASLAEMTVWAEAEGWRSIDPSGMAFSARQQTDLVLEKGADKLRVAVQPKSRSTEGAIRIQAIPTFREASIVWQPRRHKWVVELGGVPLDRAWEAKTFHWLVSRLFAA